MAGIAGPLSSGEKTARRPALTSHSDVYPGQRPPRRLAPSSSPAAVDVRHAPRPGLRGDRARRDARDARASLDELAVPQLEHEQRPDRGASPSAPASRRVEQPRIASSGTSRAPSVGGSSRTSRTVGAQLAAQPVADRHGEALLRRSRMSSGSQGRSASRRIHFFSVPRTFSAAGIGGELHQLVVEERRARLERMSHRRDVDLHDQVVRQVGAVSTSSRRRRSRGPRPRPTGREHVGASAGPQVGEARACRARHARSGPSKIET